MPKPLTIIDNDGNEVELPTRNEVCSQCEGEGRSSAYLGVIDPNEWEPDELDEYMQGRYDRTCETCKGERVVAVVDEDRLTPDQLVLWHEWERSEAEYRAICEAERRMGA